MDLNSNAILTLCSHLCVGNNVKPFEPKEWSDFATKLMNAELQPADIFNISRQEFREKLFVSDDYIDRIFRLIERNASLSVELSQIENMGINVVTRADKGYPYKLKGLEIPQISRIISVADSFDTMNSKRVYRGPLPKEEIIKQLRENSGIQFDPEVVPHMISMLEDGTVDRLKFLAS